MRRVSKYPVHAIGREKAWRLAKTEWWKESTPREIVEFQLRTQELCVPIPDLLDALQKTFGRPVLLHELSSSNSTALLDEFYGDKEAPVWQEIINLLPEERRIIVRL